MGCSGGPGRVAGVVGADTAGELTELGAHRLRQPARFGGAEARLGDHVRVVAAASAGCGSTGWCLAVWSVHNWMLTLFPAPAQEEIWGEDPAARISAALA